MIQDDLVQFEKKKASKALSTRVSPAPVYRDAKREYEVMTEEQFMTH